VNSLVYNLPLLIFLVERLVITEVPALMFVTPPLGRIPDSSDFGVILVFLRSAAKAV
jgi:hypothetical protein